MSDVHPLPFSCPLCGRPLHYAAKASPGVALKSVDPFKFGPDLHLYECRQHGRFGVTSNSDLRLHDGAAAAVRA